MKSDLDAIMHAQEIDALLVTGPASHNPAMVYLTGGGSFHGDLLKKRGEPAVLFHGPMERDEAAKTGLLTRSYADYPYRQLLEEAGGDRSLVPVMLYKRMLTEYGLSSGRVALYGQADLSRAFPLFSELQKRMPALHLVGDVASAVLGAAMVTKDAHEVERIRRMGKITTQVVAEVADYLTSRPVRDNVLIAPNGEPLTIGSIKGQINRWLLEQGAENPEETIFAIGSDAGVPHSSGNPTDVLRLGQTIVFDIFPCEPGGGYFYDFTRTWCLGYAPDEVQRLYEDVRSVFQTIQDELVVGAPFGRYQQRACELFEAMGHPTVMTNPDTLQGYVHGLGHGIGLKIHERPINTSVSPAEDALEPGMVITIEPGLYYPERGMGVRLEDSLVVRDDGVFEVLVQYPLDLILPMKQAS